MLFMCHEQILQLQFEPSHRLTFFLNEFTLDNCLKLLPRVFQIWLPRKEAVSSLYADVLTWSTLSLCLVLRR